MFVSYHRLIILSCLCIAVVALVLSIKILGDNGGRAHLLGFPSITQNSIVAQKPAIDSGVVEPTPIPAPDKSFYDTEPISTPTPTPVKSIPVSGPNITAAAYLVGDVSSGKIYISKNIKEVLPVASMSKLITAVAATDILALTDLITVTQPEMNEASETSQLAVGETYTVKELLYPLLLPSSNLAAEVLASSSDRGKFLGLMSNYAWEVGMPSTFFADPSGINPRNISTASDFFALARYLYKNRPDILEITHTTHFALATTSDHGAHDWKSIHPFVGAVGFLGGKTGHTEQAEDTMLSIFQINNQPIAIIVLRSKTGNRAGDTQLLMDEFKKRFTLGTSY